MAPKNTRADAGFGNPVMAAADTIPPRAMTESVMNERREFSPSAIDRAVDGRWAPVGDVEKALLNVAEDAIRATIPTEKLTMLT